MYIDFGHQVDIEVKSANFDPCPQWRCCIAIWLCDAHLVSDAVGLQNVSNQLEASKTCAARGQQSLRSDGDKPRQGVRANTPESHRNGADDFIVGGPP